MNTDQWVDEVEEPDPALNQITNRIIGAAVEVHKELGPGYLESTYENALAREFTRQGIRFERQKVIEVFYKGEVVGEGRVDFLVENEVIVELKAVEAITSIHAAQMMSYLKATKRRLGLIINFNVRKLIDGVRRIAR